MLRSRSENHWQILHVLTLALLSGIMILPIWHVLMHSISAPSRATGGGLYWINRGFSLVAYRMVFGDRMVQLAYRNTVFVTAFGTLLNLTLAMLAAYPLSRKDLKGRKLIQYMIFFTMLFSGGMVPTYLVVNQLKLTDTLWALIIPTAVNTYNLFVLRNFIENIPLTLQESAQIDGAGDISVLLKIILPLSKPALAVLGVMYGVAHWNSWFNCVIYINNTKLYTLQPILRQIVLLSGTASYFVSVSEINEPAMPMAVRMATVAVATLPILCLYPFLQKYFIRGIMIGAIKG